MAQSLPQSTLTAEGLAEEIFLFLEAHAGKSPNFDPQWDEPSARYTSPDASMLHAAAERLERGYTPDIVQSSWESGGFRPYGDLTARARHDRLVAAVNQRLYSIAPAPEAGFEQNPRRIPPPIRGRKVAG